MNSFATNALQLDNTLPFTWDPDWQLQQTAPQEDGETTQVRLILNKLFKSFTGVFAVHLWNGNTLRIGTGTPAFTIFIEQASVLRDIVLFTDPRRLAEAYVNGDIQILGNMHAAMQLHDYFASLSLPLHEKLGLIFRVLTLASQYMHHPQLPQATAQLPQAPVLGLDYNVSGDFYQLWLGQHMLHSCAYFTGPSRHLAQAQQTQLDQICQKLRLQHGDSLLDIDCGRATLACWAAKQYGAFVHGITSNPDEYADAIRQVQSQGLSHLVTIELIALEELPHTNQYDKVASISIAGHVGSDQLPDWFAKIHQLLKPGGLFLNHAITSEQAAGQQTNAFDFMHQHLYPQGKLTNLPQRLALMDTALFEVYNVEGLRRHYVMTLREWLAALEEQQTAATALVGEQAYRLWRLSLATSILEFEQGITGMHQMLATRR